MPQEPSITSWTRLEPRTRAADMTPGLQARTADPLWLLGRQWQVGEFQGEDAGSPVSVRLRADCARLTRYQGDADPAPLPLDADLPLEAVVERDTPAASLDRRTAAQLGLEYLRLLRDEGAGAVAALLAAAYPISAAPGPVADDATTGYLAAVAGRAPDGLALAAELAPAQGTGRDTPSRVTVPAALTAAVTRATAAWRKLLGLPVTAPTGGGAWIPQRLEHGFSVAARHGDDETVLRAAEYPGGRLDWYAFDHRPGATLGTPAAAPQKVVRTVLPTVASYPGMPATRWWEMEDARVYWGGLTAESTDLARLLLAEYATSYANDYFLVPLELPAGTVTRVTSVVVTDTFGERVLLPPAPQDWTLFRSSVADSRDTADLLLLLPGAVDALDGEPVEEVLFLRDEAANLAWAVEEAVAGAAGHRVDRHRLAAVTGALPPAPVATGQGVMRRYRLQSTVPEHWVPLAPVPDPAAPGRTLLHRYGAGARGQILQPGTTLRLPSEEVPREGVRVTRRWQLARTAAGATALWSSRATLPGRGEGSSGLRFDTADPA
ncbi:hypothetical protein [Streptomyces sp. NPDC058751]|uniref:hypothetical protein n=1 Tax=Streptomyces sp. NPDC058751 TaxID=3346623 RepID=UPI0036AA71D6